MIDFKFVQNLLIAVFVRTICAIFSYSLINLTAASFDNSYVYCGYICIILMFVELFYTITVNEAKEYKFLSRFLVLFITSIIPSIWVYQLNQVCIKLRSLIYGPNFEFINIDPSKIKNEFNASAEMSEHLILFTETIFYILIILTRWYLPTEEITSNEAFSMVANNVTLAIDMRELFSTIPKYSFIIEQVDQDELFFISELWIWSWSLPLLVINYNIKLKHSIKSPVFQYLSRLFNDFYWKYLINIMLVDGPFFMLRSIISFIFNEKTNFFFIFKNLILFMMQFYRFLEHKNEES